MSSRALMRIVRIAMVWTQTWQAGSAWIVRRNNPLNTKSLLTFRTLCSKKHQRPTSAVWSQDSSSVTDDKSLEESRLRRRLAKQKRKALSRERRRFYGLAKAVDRGQHTVTYKPGGDNGTTFQALSGLPEKTSFVVLGIESSCDDTGAAVVRSDGTILGEALASQAAIHEEWGGIVPMLARQAHEDQIDVIVEQALAAAGLTSVEEVDAIGVTVGPGLEVCLRVGCRKAQALALQHNKPFVGVHHLEAHILMARLFSAATADDEIGAGDEKQQRLDFPFLALLVSGGHCQLIQCWGIGRYTIMGGTMDDSLGEAFDKTARMLGLPVGGGGGPRVEALARQGNATALPLPIPLRQRRDLDFSYAGLKTAVRVAAERLAVQHEVETASQLPESVKADVAASFQNCAIQHVEQRLGYAMDRLESTQSDAEEDTFHKTLAVVGGVAANTELRTRLDQLCAKRGWNMVVPPPRLCTDQGTMSAWAAIERLLVRSSDDPENQEVYARYPFAETSARESEESV